MKKVLAGLLFALASVNANAAADLVLVGTNGHNAGTTCSPTAGSVSAGDTIIAVISFDPGANINSLVLSGSGSDTLTQLGTTIAGAAKIAVYVKENATGGASVGYTVTFSTGAFGVCHLLKATGVAAASIDTASRVQNNTDNASPWTITSNAFAQANNIVVAVIEQNSGGSTPSAYSSTNFTIVSQETDIDNYWGSAVGKLYVASTSAVTPSWTRAGSNNTAVASQQVFGLKEAGGGGGGTVCNPMSGRCGAAAPPLTLH